MSSCIRCLLLLTALTETGPSPHIGSPKSPPFRCESASMRDRPCLILCPIYLPPCCVSLSRKIAFTWRLERLSLGSSSLTHPAPAEKQEQIPGLFCRLFCFGESGLSKSPPPHCGTLADPVCLSLSLFSGRVRHDDKYIHIIILAKKKFPKTCLFPFGLDLSPPAATRYDRINSKQIQIVKYVWEAGTCFD
jgi:hypothetical protein